MSYFKFQYDIETQIISNSNELKKEEEEEEEEESNKNIETK